MQRLPRLWIVPVNPVTQAPHCPAIDLARCVYTALTDGYETLNEQPAAAASGIPFICFTDKPGITSGSWQIRPLQRMFERDGYRSQRAYKLRPHAVLPEFHMSLYIDNSVLLKVPPEQIFTAFASPSGLSLPTHSFRASLLDEFIEVAQNGLDAPAIIAEQLALYRALYPQTLAERPFWNGILLRDHRNPTMIAAMELWLAQVYRYSRRDQLSAPVAFARVGLRPNVMAIDNYDSWFHSWPHIHTRDPKLRLWQPKSEADIIAAQILSLEREAATMRRHMQTLTEEHDILLRSTSWRATAPLRALVHRLRRRQP